MALRAEQWMVLGVGLLGAFAVGQLLFSKPRGTPLPDVERPPGPLPGFPPPGPIPPPPPGGVTRGTFGALNLIGRPPWSANSAGLRNGAHYKGRIEPSLLTTSQDPRELSRFAADTLRMAGFDEIGIYTPAEARGTVVMPLDQPFTGATNATRFFLARFGGTTRVHTIPDAILLLFPEGEEARLFDPSYVPVPELGPAFATRGPLLPTLMSTRAPRAPRTMAG